MALLQDDFWPAIFHDDIGHGAIDYAHSLATRSTRIASCFLELEKMNQDLESKLRNDFNNILNSMGKFSVSLTPQPVSPPIDPPTRTSASAHNTPFTIAAYTWLLDNIANPYPPPTMKSNLAQKYNTSLSAVNAWFVSARRRMGWTTLCRNYFNGCRADALDAAYRALVDEDLNRPLPPDIIHAFIGVKVAAEGLYSSTFTKSVLAGDLDAVVKDVADQDTASVGERGRSNLTEVTESMKASELRNKEPVTQHYYPSDYSCSSSPVPPLDESLTDDTEEEEEASPPVLVGRKRRLSCSEPNHATVTTKRMKHLSLNGSFSTEACPPSVSTSPEEFSATDSDNQEQRSRPISQNSTNTSALRKRCLSDADTTRTPKRSRGLTLGPCLHDVPDALPLSALQSDHTIDEWFISNFDTLFTLPPPVGVVEPDLSAQWEVELFNDYSIPAESWKTPFDSLDLPAEDQASTSVDLSVFDEFLKSLESEGLVVPSDTFHPATVVSAADSVPRNSSSESIDWNALLSGQTLEPSLDSLAVQPRADLLSLPEVDTSILQLP